MQIFILHCLFRYLVLVLSISLHQSIEAWLSAHLGDTSAKDAGRLSLNPFCHYDFHGFIVAPVIALLYLLLGLPAEIFGWGRKLPFHQNACKRSERAPLLIGMGGLLTYASLGMFFYALPFIVQRFVDLPYDIVFPFQALCQSVGNVNLVLLCINLIPFPRLDAALILMTFLPKKLQSRFLNLARFEAVFIFFFTLSVLGLVSFFT